MVVCVCASAFKGTGVRARARAGGLPALLRALKDGTYLRKALTVNGKDIGENVSRAPNYNTDVIASVVKPIQPEAGIAVLHGNLAPHGAVIKPSAASPHLFRHRGRAVVFESVEHMKAVIDSPDLAVDENCVLVLKGAGPRGYPGACATRVRMPCRAALRAHVAAPFCVVCRHAGSGKHAAA